MKIHGTAKGAALSTKDFGVAFSAAAAPAVAWYTQDVRDNSVAFTKRSGTPFILAYKNDTGSTESTTSILISMCRYGSPVGTIYGGIWDNVTPNPNLITTGYISGTDGLDVSTLNSNPNFEPITFNFSATDVLADYSVGCWTDDNMGTGDNFALIGVDLTPGDIQIRLYAQNWSYWDDRLMTCTISG